MTKEEKIKEAWVVAYEALSPYIDNNGWVRASNLHFYSTDSLPFKTDTLVMDGRDWYRPLVLSGINDNNGWNKINSRADLPKSEGMYLFMCDDSKYRQLWHQEDISHGGVTHWREIKPIHSPVY